MRNFIQNVLCLRAPRVAGWPVVAAAGAFLLGAGPDLRAQSIGSPTQAAATPIAPPPAADTTSPDASSPDMDNSSIPAASTEQPKTTLTWEQSVRMALAHNPDLEVFRDNVLNSDAVRRGAYSLLYPQIALSFGATRSYVGPFLGAPSNYSNEFSGQISLSQTIFNGFLTQGNISQARAELALAFANLDSQKALTSFDLKTAFAQVIYAQQNVDVARRVIDINQNNARLVKLLYDSGNEDKGAWLLSKAQLDQAIFTYNQAVRNVEVSDQQLVTILGQDLPRPIEAIGKLDPRLFPAPFAGRRRRRGHHDRAVRVLSHAGRRRKCQPRRSVLPAAPDDGLGGRNRFLRALRRRPELFQRAGGTRLAAVGAGQPALGNQ